MDAKEEAKELHAKLTSDLNEQFGLFEADRYEQLVNRLKAKLSPKVRKEAKNIMDILEALERNGTISPGNYQYLKNVINEYDVRVVDDFIEPTERAIQIILSRGQGTSGRSTASGSTSCNNQGQHSADGDGKLTKKRKLEEESLRPTSICSIETMTILTEVSKSVGYITGKKGSGTCWRVGYDKIITAAHVVKDNICNTFLDILDEDDLKSVKVDFVFISKKSSSVFEVEPKVLFIDEHLDVAVLQLKPDDEKQFPPPIKTFHKLNPEKDDDKHIYLISHNKGEKKEVNFGIGIWNPTEKRLEDLEKFCRKYGKENGYKDVERKDRLVIQCDFVGGASGSPGIVIYNNVAYVVFVYIRGFPSFYYSQQFPDEERRKFPSDKLLQQGVNIGDLFDTMSKNEAYFKLRDEIFPEEAKKQYH